MLLKYTPMLQKPEGFRAKAQHWGIERQVNTMTTNVRAHVLVSGRVQGVFFREETRRAADRLKVNGWVRNRSDGTVEALFEGTEQAVNAAIAWCRDGSPSAEVADVRVSREPYAGDLDGFVIKKSV